MSLKKCRHIFKRWHFESDIGIVNLHPTKGTFWVAYNEQKHFDSFGAAPGEKLSKFFRKSNGPSLCSEYKIQGLDSYCAAFCFLSLFIILDKNYRNRF